MVEQMYVGEEMNPDAMDEISKIPDGEPIAIISQFQFKEWAEYPAGTVTKNITGRQAYKRYRELVIPLINKVGGVPIWRGGMDVTLIGPEDDYWDEVSIVQFPARSAFEHLIADPEYQKIVFHCAAAVKDSRRYVAASPEYLGPMKWKLFNLSKWLGD